MSRLSAAYYGYSHQDCVVAYALATLLLPRSSYRTITADRKALDGDCFDDMELAGKRRRRVQIKAHSTEPRHLQLADFTTKAISFRIDTSIRSICKDPDPADEYRLLATYDQPESALLPFLEPDLSTPPLLPGLATQRFRLDSSRIWPDGESPVWPHITDIGREAFILLCKRLVVEVGCPRSSGDLRRPGPLERALLDMLRNRIGIGTWPNHNRDLADAAAHLIYAAGLARITSATCDQHTVIDTLALVIDYGRVEERFPIDDHRLVPRDESLDEIVTMLTESPRLTIIGSPGIGKSWLLCQLVERLLDSGWLVASHYCFVGLLDVDRSRRASLETTFGSIIAELLDADPSLATDSAPRFAAGPRELQQLLDAAAEESSDRRIAIIIDGLDHADRIPQSPKTGVAADIVEELAMLSLPPNVSVVIGSQPGEHLTSFLDVGTEYRVCRWRSESIRELAKCMGTVEALYDGSLGDDTERVLDVIAAKADGNPLYATYLARTVIALAGQDADTILTGDIVEYLAGVPAFDQDLDAYYQWLVTALARDTGAYWTAELLSLLDFSVSADELRQIRPEFSHHIDIILSCLSPILVEDITQGGFRVYHESFQRYMLQRLEADPGADISAILAPVINWLEARGFFADIRAFRSLLRLMHKAGRDTEVIAHVGEDFVASAAAHGQPADAVLANLSIAATTATARQDWLALAHLIEVSRAADHLYGWRLIDHRIAEAYGRAYAALFGPNSLADCLLHSGRCTFLPRPGLLLCHLCDEQGAIPPWTEYLTAHDLQRQIERVDYGTESDVAIQSARLTGRLRISGREQSVQECTVWLALPESAPDHPYEIAFTLGDMYGVDALMAVIDQVPARTARSWARLALAQILNDPDEAKVQANNAIRDGLPRSGWRACLNEGADPSLFSWDVVRLHELTAKVVAPGIHYQDGLLSQWLTEVQIAAAVGDAIALSGTEACVPTDTWFHRWLRFSLMLMHPESTQEDIVASLQDLGQDVEVFEGDPRVCDLYSFHGTIQRSFRDALSRLDDIRWGQALDALGEISSETSTWLQGARGGPLPLDALFELCFATCDSDAKKLSASNFGTRLLAPGRRGAEYYDTHAHDQLLLTRLHAASGKANEAEKAWHEACQYLVGYGQRKDITIYELLDPIETLARVDPRRTRHCLCDCQPAVERVLLHTDGSETSHAKHKWLDLIADVHPAGALSYLAREEVDRLPTFGSLHHALPKALAALEGQVDSLQLVAGWIGAGSESRSEPRAAVAACEEVVCESPEVGYALWDTVVGSLDGDGVQPLPDLCSVVAHSAHRAGVAAPVICSAAFQDDSDTSATDHPRLVSERAKHAFTPFLPVNATPLQIVHRIRRWLSSLEKGQDVDSVTNAVGWRLMEMIHAGNETSAEIIIRRIAHDMSMWDRSNLLPALAQGLVLHGAARLAALANTFAYTRVSDGWRRFAGPKAESLFLKALDLDASVAWSTVAEEVAESVARGGDYGVTVHLVELLAIGGRVSEAFAAWSAACRVVTFRLQPTGPQDNIDVIYSPDCDSPSEKLAEVMVARLNHLSIHVRRLATAAAALMVRHYPGAFSASVRLAVEYDSPPSTLITLLHIMSRFEPEPYDATRLVENGLRDAVASDLVSARVLAFRLLNRAGLHCHLPSPKSTPLLAVLPDGRVDKLVGMIGRHRIEGVEEIWPEFGRLVAGRVNAILKSDDLREQMQRTLRRVGTKREGRKQELWLPVDEEIERILQTTGAAVRSALAQDGIFDLRIEAQVGMRLLGNLDIAVRLVLSRAVRPAYIPLCSSLEVGHCVSEPITVPDGQFKGWVIIAHKETELVVGSDYEKPVVSKVSAYSGVSFCANWRDGTGLPVGFGYPEIWYSPVSASRMADLFQGPLVGLNFVRDAFGAIEVLAPHPVVPIVGRLVPTTFDRGFALSDIEGELAVVCKTWQQRFIGNQYPVDREPRITGMHILLRPDVFEMVEACAVEPARYVTVVSLDRTGATAE